MAGQDVQGMLIRLEATTAQLRQEMARADSTVAQVSGRDSKILSSFHTKRWHKKFEGYRPLEVTFLI